LPTQPVVELLDQSAAVVVTATNAVTASIKPGTGAPGAVLQGTTTVNAVAGVATFSDLRIDSAATGYVLTFAGNGIPPTDSAPFDVAPAAAAKLTFSRQPGGATTGDPLVP